MAVNDFSRAVPANPTSIGAIVVTLKDDDGAKSAHYHVEILDQNGKRMAVPDDAGDLVPHLAQADIAWLIDFMGRMRVKAVAGFLGG